GGIRRASDGGQICERGTRSPRREREEHADRRNTGKPGPPPHVGGDSVAASRQSRRGIASAPAVDDCDGAKNSRGETRDALQNGFTERRIEAPGGRAVCVPSRS